ncbi:hypothetical protein AgCh_011944 [Apium graveolens]
MKFKDGDLVLLKVSPWKGLSRFGKKGKLNPRYVGPFKILKRVGKVAYELALPPHMEHIHNVFHVSMLKKYNPDSRHVIEYEPIELQAYLSYVDNPIEILEKREKVSIRPGSWSNYGPDVSGRSYSGQEAFGQDSYRIRSGTMVDFVFCPNYAPMFSGRGDFGHDGSIRIPDRNQSGFNTN